MQSETIGKLADALSKAQGEMRPAAMDRDNPFFKSKYATLASLWDSARKAIAANGLSVVQTTEISEGDLFLVTTLMHASGEYISGIYPVKSAGMKPQEIGSAITYARRYSFGAILGLSSDDDDDGNAASHPQERKEGGQSQPAGVAATISNVQEGAKRTDNPNGNTGNGVSGKVTMGTLKRLHAVGTMAYGDEWDARRHKMVSAITVRRTDSSKDLMETEAVRLINGIEEKIRQEGAAVTVAEVAELNVFDEPEAVTA